MEKIKVTFKGDKREINIDFLYDRETGKLNYNLVAEPLYEKDKKSDLEFYLVSKLLNSLAKK